MSLLTVGATIFAVVQLTRPAPAHAQPAPSVGQIIDRYVTAIGGKAAVEKITSRSVKGTIDLPGIGSTASFEFHAKAPNKRVTIITVPGLGPIKEAFSGAEAWSSNPLLGTMEKNGAELVRARREAEFYRDIRLKEIYPKMVYKGQTNVGDRTAHLVEASPRDGGSPELFYFDTQTGLMIRQDAQVETGGMVTKVEVYFEDHRVIDGVKQPFTIRSPLPPEASFTIKLTEVKNNIPLEDARFEKPAAR